MRLFFILLLVSFQAIAVSWDDLEPGTSYKVAQNFQLPILERSGSMIDITKGEKAVYRGSIPISIPGYPMILYQFDYLNCPGMQMVTDIEIVSIQNSGRVIQVGAQLDESCVLQVYVEGQYWKTNSLFE